MSKAAAADEGTGTTDCPQCRAYQTFSEGNEKAYGGGGGAYCIHYSGSYRRFVGAVFFGGLRCDGVWTDLFLLAYAGLCICIHFVCIHEKKRFQLFFTALVWADWSAAALSGISFNRLALFLDRFDSCASGSGDWNHYLRIQQKREETVVYSMIGFDELSCES